MFEVPISNSGWTKVALGELAINSTVATLQPEEDGFVRYIIGKHIPGDGNKITTWNEVGDGEFGSRIRTIIKKGDIICTTRGPKLRVAVATFDCLSAHTNFVLRTKDSSALMQEFLQAIACSEAFQDHLRGNFRGSTNLFVNWSDAAAFEFLLPPIQEQARLVSGIAASHDAVEKLLCAVEAQKALAQSALLQALRPSARPSVKIGDVAIRVTNGFVGSAVKHYVEDGIPYLRSLNVRRSGLDLSDMVYISQEFHEATRKSQLEEGDVLTVQSGHVGETAVVPKSCVGWNCHALILTRLDLSRINPEYLAIYLNSEIGQRHLQRFFVGSTVAHLNTSDLEKLVIPFPSLAEQVQIAELGRDLLASADTMKQRLDSVRAITRQMLEHALSGHKE